LPAADLLGRGARDRFRAVRLALDDLTVRVLDFFSDQVPIVPEGTSPADIGLLLNIAFFVPVGASMAWWLGEHWGWAVPLALALSATLELGQYLVSRIGRDPSLADIACNAIGAAAGAVVVAMLRWQRPEHGPPSTNLRR
jgi:glycopeptide antibiotics resistance protein